LLSIAFFTWLTLNAIPMSHCFFRSESIKDYRILKYNHNQKGKLSGASGLEKVDFPEPLHPAIISKTDILILV
jgi:hypothetical protein